MARVTFLLCALLFATLILQGEGCKKLGKKLGRWWKRNGTWIKKGADIIGVIRGRQVPASNTEDYSFNYSEMLDGIKQPGLMTALKAYDTDNDGTISGEENTEMIEKATVVFYYNDADKDGQLNSQELQGFVHEMTNLQVEKVFSEQEQEQMFADLDIDGNGALTQDEMYEPTVVEDILKVFATSKSG